MINKKVMALMLSASMVFTLNAPVMADDEVAAADTVDGVSTEVIGEDAITGSCKMHFSLDAKGDYAKTGKKSVYVLNADGSVGVDDVDVSFSSNSYTGDELPEWTQTDTEVSYVLKADEANYYRLKGPGISGVRHELGTRGFRNDKYEFDSWINKKTLDGEDIEYVLREIGVSLQTGGSYRGFYGSDEDINIDFSKLGQLDYYLTARPLARYDASFNLFTEDFNEEEYDEDGLFPIYVDNGDGTYSVEKLLVSFKDDEYQVSKYYYADKTTGFAFKAPEIEVEGYELEKWIVGDSTKKRCGDKYKDIKAGESFTLPEVTDGSALEDYPSYYVVLKKISAQSENSNSKTNDKIVEKTVSVNAGNHTIALKMNEAPAYTGGKLRATDFISSFKIDGKEYPAKDIKIKVEGEKKVGSKVKVTIKKIKGADKQTNKDVKGTVLGEVTIRPIDVSEVTTWNKTFTKEGQIVVKTNKNGDIKSVAAVVSKKGVNSGDNKAKKLKVKKGTYTYDSAKKTITFNDGAICKGSVTVK